MISSSTLIVSRNSQVAKPRCAAKSTSRRRDARPGHPVAEHQCGGDDQHDDAGAAQRLGNHVSVRLTGKPRYTPTLTISAVTAASAADSVIVMKPP